MTMSSKMLICAPMRLEARALRSAQGSREVGREMLRGNGLHGDTTVRCTGYGPKRSAHSAVRLLAADFDVLLVAGLAGGLTPDVGSGDVVVASEIRSRNDVVPCGAADSLAAELVRSGFPVRRGPIVSTDRLVHGSRRTELAATGALAVDLESAVLAQAAGERPVAVVRVVVDAVGQPLLHPGTARRGLTALARLHAVGACLRRWGRHIPPEIHTTREEA
ncbi:lipoprotein [Saccharopolyspora halophila]|uniref:Lipoprotein n=1 Tax=Saccharopolyspora halophila TaxID=405551 RepID=A0ABP5TLG6_9PSEU